MGVAGNSAIGPAGEYFRALVLTLCYAGQLLQQSVAMLSKVNREQLRAP